MLCHACHMIDMQVSFHRSICLKTNRLIHFLIVLIVIWARPARNKPMNYTSWSQRWQIITDSGYFGRSMEGVTRVKRDRDMRLSKIFRAISISDYHFDNDSQQSRESSQNYWRIENVMPKQIVLFYIFNFKQSS